MEQERREEKRGEKNVRSIRKEERKTEKRDWVRAANGSADLSGYCAEVDQDPSACEGGRLIC
jgi:hypothetical protein